MTNGDVAAQQAMRIQRHSQAVVALAVLVCFAVPANALRDQDDVMKEQDVPFANIKANIQGKLSHAASQLVESSLAQAKVTKNVADNIGHYNLQVKNIAATMGSVMQAETVLTQSYRDDIARGEAARTSPLVDMDMASKDALLPGNASFSALNSEADEDDGPRPSNASFAASAHAARPLHNTSLAQLQLVGHHNKAARQHRHSSHQLGWGRQGRSLPQRRGSSLQRSTPANGHKEMVLHGHGHLATTRSHAHHHAGVLVTRAQHSTSTSQTGVDVASASSRTGLGLMGTVEEPMDLQPVRKGKEWLYRRVPVSPEKRNARRLQHLASLSNHHRRKVSP